MQMVRINKWLQIGTRLAIIFIITFSVCVTTYGQTDGINKNDYTLLAPLPGTTLADGKTTNFQTYLPGLFKFAISLAAVMAFATITYGGILYMTTDAIYKKEDGKKWITNAVWGLVLVIASWVILNTINPQILNFDLTIPRPILSGGPAIRTGVPMTPEQITASNRVKAQLEQNGVSVNAGPCERGQTTGCTNFNGLPASAVKSLIDLKKACNCTVMVTGGTEDGHETHGVSQPVVDLSPDQSLSRFLGVPNPVGLPRPSRITKGGGTFTFEKKGDGGARGDHWHVTF